MRLPPLANEGLCSEKPLTLQGSFSSGCRNGQGKLYFKDTDVTYDGLFADDFPEKQAERCMIVDPPLPEPGTKNAGTAEVNADCPLLAPSRPTHRLPPLTRACNARESASSSA